MSTMLKRSRSRPSEPAEHAHLADDLAGGEIANQAHLPGQAEIAPHGAPDLGGHAEGIRRGLGNEHRLDAPVVTEFQQKLLRPVGRSVPLDDAGRPHRAGTAQFGAKRLRQVRHGGEVLHAALVDPAVDLPRVEALCAEVRQRLLKLGEIEAGCVDRRRRGAVGLHGEWGGVWPAGSHADRSTPVAAPGRRRDVRPAGSAPKPGRSGSSRARHEVAAPAGAWYDRTSSGARKAL